MARNEWLPTYPIILVFSLLLTPFGIVLFCIKLALVRVVAVGTVVNKVFRLANCTTTLYFYFIA